jgi:hypothetical protein
MGDRLADQARTARTLALARRFAIHGEAKPL